MTMTMEPQNGTIVPTPPARVLVQVRDEGQYANLLDSSRFDQCWRIAKLFAATTMIPQHFQGKPEDCFVGIQMAMRLGIDPLMFLQNTYVTKGKPGMEGKLAISLINTSGLFRGPLRFVYTGSKGTDQWGCTGVAILKETGETVEGPTVTIAIAKAEGWYAQNPKWKNIPEMMLLYRAGAWFGRTVCPERLMGMQTIDELNDVANEAPAAPSPQNIMQRLTSRPVSENQTFVPDENAAQQIANQNSVIDSETGEVIDTIPADKAGPDVSTWEKTKLALTDASMDANTPEGDVFARVSLWLLSKGAKGSEDTKTTPEDRALLVEAVREKRLNHAGKIIGG